jgi:hypothetical protein
MNLRNASVAALLLAATILTIFDQRVHAAAHVGVAGRNPHSHARITIRCLQEQRHHQACSPKLPRLTITVESL